jgi:4-alpha-glucanotransferase
VTASRHAVTSPVRRAAGILLHPTSLPGRFGIGDVGPMAERFLDWLASAGQSIWQMLPLHPTGSGASPYGAVSSFAGNPLLISPEKLVEDGLAPAAALSDVPDFPADRVEWARVREWKDRFFRATWAQASRSARVREELDAFRSAPEQKPWLADWALYAARRSTARREDSGPISAEIEYQEFLQMTFFLQWDRLRWEARRRGISLFGDVPIYVSPDSVDVEAHRNLFALDAEGRALEVAGVPPDFFSETGQLWGYPLYRWDRMAEDGYAWWIARLRSAFRLTDIVRLDHFRAFAAYWAVPAGERTAVNGRWRRGPGRKLFDAMRRTLGNVPLVAEDLGTITPDVKRLLARLGIPGMKVLQFAFYEADNTYLPHRHVPNAVVYTGTHDNDTTVGWWTGEVGHSTRSNTEIETERQYARRYLGFDGREVHWEFIRAVLASVADTAIVPAQDLLGLGSAARMNRPGTVGGNWRWRLLPGQLTHDIAQRLAMMTETYDRI